MNEVQPSHFFAFAQKLIGVGPIHWWRTLTGVYYGGTLAEVLQKIEKDRAAQEAGGVISIVIGVCVNYDSVKKENRYDHLGTFPWSAIQTLKETNLEPSNEETYFRFEIYSDEKVFLWNKVVVPTELIVMMADLANTIFARDTKPGEKVYIFVLQRKEIV